MNQEKIKNSLIKYVNNHCQNNMPCIIDISKMTPFEWDRAYFFDEKGSEATINEALGFDYKNYSEMSSHIIFIKDNHIVHDEAYFTDPDYRHHKNYLFFALSVDHKEDPNSPHLVYFYLTPKNAKLHVYHKQREARGRDVNIYSIWADNAQQGIKDNPYEKNIPDYLK